MLIVCVAGVWWCGGVVVRVRGEEVRGRSLSLGIKKEKRTVLTWEYVRRVVRVWLYEKYLLSNSFLQVSKISTP